MQHLKTTPQQTAERLLSMTSIGMAVEVCDRLIQYSHSKMLTVHYMAVRDILITEPLEKMLRQHENERFYLHNLN
jgi:hypothetical protein